MTNLQINEALKKVKEILEVINEHTLIDTDSDKEALASLSKWKHIRKAINSITESQVVIHKQTK
tara:strand:+ start:502 stop:693 length:192 start_codon:yes stop_codon:yes gene_type:complete